MPSNIEKSRKDKVSESVHWWDRQHSLVLRQTPRWAQGFVIGLTTLGIGVIIAAYTIKIDEVITVNGKLTPGLGSVKVKTPAGGLIEEVKVKEGQSVMAGDLLMKFDSRNAKSKIELYEEQIKQHKISKKTSLRQLSLQTKTMELRLNTEKLILKDMIPLQAQGAASRNMILNQENKVLQIQSEIDQIKSQELGYISDHKRRLKELQTERDIAKVSAQYESVQAPVSGIVFQINARKSGVLSSGEVIMVIIPQDKLKAEVRVTNKDIGFVKVGQKTNIRVSAFDYTRFGTLTGFVKSIGADAIEPDRENQAYTFPVSLELEETKLKFKGNKINMKSGYAITANLKLKEKRLIAIVSDLMTTQYDSLQTIRQ